VRVKGYQLWAADGDHNVADRVPSLAMTMCMMLSSAGIPSRLVALRLWTRPTRRADEGTVSVH